MENGALKYYRFNALLQQQRWISPAYVGVTHDGIIKYLSDLPPQFSISVEAVDGYALPGFQNAHAHAFQYAMAGTAEKHLPGSSDDFWSWRETMYEHALRMEPDELEAIAAMLYAEMLRNGYTHVAEFHYLHHDRDGRPYKNLAEMGARLVAAAKSAGIKITLVPVFYQKGGFGKSPEPRQRRFISKTIDKYFDLLDQSAKEVQHYQDARLGFGIHSLRAVDANDIFKTFEEGPKHLPFHLHAAEQLKEVKDCIKYFKQRPIAWLLDHLPVNDRFHIVHATHMQDDELKQLAQSGANVVLCPSTEANLGDGIFRLADYSHYFGNWSIGTDSHVNLNPLEDLRWLDYAQRLVTHKRNTFADGATILLNKTIPRGRLAMGINMSNFFEVDHPLDAIVYSAKVPLLMKGSSEHLLPSILYTADPSCTLGTIVNGAWVVKDRHHVREDSIRSKYLKALNDLHELHA